MQSKIYLLISILILPLSIYSEESKTENAPPNILLISIDTLRPDHLGCYGYKRETSPNIDAFSKQGVIFKNCISPTSWTLPAHISVLTGLYPTVHGVTNRNCVLKKSYTTLAEALKKNGYKTAGFVTGPNVKAEFGFNQGFDLYDDFTVELDKDIKFTHENKRMDELYTETSPIIYNLALDWLKKNKNERFFLFTHFWDVHSPYSPPAPYETMFMEKGDLDFITPHEINEAVTEFAFGNRNKYDKDLLDKTIKLYDAEIRYTDYYIGLLLKLLDDYGLKDNTLVIIFSDHGEGFMEHERLVHRNSLFDEAIKTALIMRYPSFIPSGKIIPDEVSLVDIMPTILDFTDTKTQTPIQGLSLKGLINTGDISRKHVFSELEINEASGKRDIISVRENTLKLIINTAEDRKELYDLIQDPRESMPLKDDKRVNTYENTLLDFMKNCDELHASYTGE